MKLPSVTFLCDYKSCGERFSAIDWRHDATGEVAHTGPYLDLVADGWVVDRHDFSREWKHYCPVHADEGARRD